LLAVRLQATLIVSPESLIVRPLFWRLREAPPAALPFSGER
jgi:hypothetical protein